MFRLTPGCFGVQSNSALTDTLAFQDAGCPFRGVAYGPSLNRNSRHTEKDVTACQDRCRNTLGCAYFTFWWLDGACLLHGSTATWALAPDAVSGPSVCFAAVDLHISGVRNQDLTAVQ